MAKIGRNHPCPCGSGKKYKLCCLAKDEAAASEARAREIAARSPIASGAGLPFVYEDDGLDDASNSVVDLIHAGKLDEAERAAEDLLLRFPDVHDGYDRLGMVYEKRGDPKRAAHYYRKVVEFIQQHPDGFDPEVEVMFRRRAERLDPTAGG